MSAVYKKKAKKLHWLKEKFQIPWSLAFTLTNLFLDLRKLKSLYLEGNSLQGNFSIDLALVN